MVNEIWLASFIGNNIPKDTNPTELLSMFIALVVNCLEAIFNNLKGIIG